MSLEEDAKRGARARALLEDPIFVEAFEALTARYYEAWRATQPGDEAARERLFTLSTALGDVRGHFEQVAENGDLAERQLDELRGRRRILGPSW